MFKYEEETSEEIETEKVNDAEAVTTEFKDDEEIKDMLISIYSGTRREYVSD